jgi:hypothetical protein
VGNYDGAVDTCLKAGRLADALLIANIGGAELFKKTMQRYMRRNPRPYMAVSGLLGDRWGHMCRQPTQLHFAQVWAGALTTWQRMTHLVRGLLNRGLGVDCAAQVISAMVDGDYMSLVKTRPVGQWRETLAVLATYTGVQDH